MLRVVFAYGNKLLTRNVATTSVTGCASKAAAPSLTKTEAESEEAGFLKPEDEVGEIQNEKKTALVKEQYSADNFTKLKLHEYPYYVEREWWKTGTRTCFWATWRQLRDWKRRLLIQETGADRMRLKAIKENTILPQVLRDEAADELLKMPKYSHPKLVLNMCMFTGRQRGKIKPYRLNRHLFRRYADHSQLSGVQRAMW